METLIIQVDCRPYMREGGRPPQLGITVEDSSYLQRKQLKAATKDYNEHNYHNLDDIQISPVHNREQLSTNDKSRANTNGGSTKYSAQLAASLAGGKSTNSCLIYNNFNQRPIQDGLQITQIHEGSVIDQIGAFKIYDIIVEVNGVSLQRPFAEAQKTLKQFVIEHTSHAPLVLKVLRKLASSSSIPSTSGSQITIIEHNDNNKNRPRQQTPAPLQQKAIAQQQVKKSSLVNQITPVKSSSPTSLKTSSTSSKTSRHLVGALNTRRIGTKYNIRLRKGPNGFGIKIAERDNMHNTKNRPIYVTAITTNGSAYQDGQLKEGDMLLEVNGLDLHGKSQPEVTKMLKSVGVNEEVEIVVSRQEIVANDSQNNHSELDSSDQTKTDTYDNDDSLIDLNVPDQDDSVFVDNSNQEFEKRIDSILNSQQANGPGEYVYDIPLNDTKSAGLGLYLKYPRRSSDRQDLGIWIEKVITGGAAWKDGRLQPNDRILAINGISLVGLSNSKAHETLNAAICRGIGPEATPNTIRLYIQRLDPTVAAKVLLATQTRIEHSDVIKKSNEIVQFNGGQDQNSRDSYQTAYDTIVRNESTQSNVLNDSSGSSNQNSQSDSAMSPQTQASSSLKLYDEKQNSSDKTNETTSSAISQVTDFTSVPNSENATVEQYNSVIVRTTATIPKKLDSEVQSEFKTTNEDNASSNQSWDDESLDAAGEEAFQRDGFGRQSISEKRHAQLNAKNTDTFKRNQQAREERERQRKLEEQMARQHIGENIEDKRQNQFVPIRNDREMPSSYTANEFKSIYGLQTGPDKNPNQSEHMYVGTYHREVPVDVHMPTVNKVFINSNQANMQMCYDNAVQVNYNEERARILGQKSVPNMYQHQGPIVNHRNIIQSSRCLKCGAYESNCLCESLSQQQHVEAMRSAYQIYGGISNPGFDHNILKRSNSLESIQQHQVRNDLIVPRAGTVRVARNRKVNESFRAAVDRSYDGSTTNESSSRQDQSEISSDHRTIGVGLTRITSSIANSTVSTSNDEKYLVNNHKSINTVNKHQVIQKKSTSLLTKFLKFGSMKKKKKNRHIETNETKEATDIKSSQDGNSSQNNRVSEQSARSQLSKGFHSRNHSSQSHPNISSNHERRNSQISKQTNPIPNGQYISNNMKQEQVLLANNNNNNLQDGGFNVHQQHRMSLPMCQQYQQPIKHNNLNTHCHPNQAQHMATQPKQQYQYNNLTLGRQPTGGHHLGNNNHIHHQQQYSHLPIHQGTAAMMPLPSLSHQQQQHYGFNQTTVTNHHIGHPIDSMHNHPMHYQTLLARDNNTRQGVNNNPPQLIQQNGCPLGGSNPQSNQWHPSHAAAPNGLWVTNSPTADNLQQQQQPPMQGIYGTSPQQQVSTRLPQIVGPPPPLQQQQQLPSAHNHVNGQIYGATHYAATGIAGGVGNHHHHIMEPQHIRYYDY